MKIAKKSSDVEILRELGQRVARLRLAQNLTQAKLAEKADVAKRTVERLESGTVAPQLAGFIRICRALDRVECFDLVVPEDAEGEESPQNSVGKKRQRASSTGDRSEETVGQGSGVASSKMEREGETTPSEDENPSPAASQPDPAPQLRADLVVVAHHLN